MNRTASLVLTLLFLGTALALVANAQETAVTSPGIELFNKGDYAGAVAALKDTKNYIELMFLGVAYEKLGKGDSAGKAFDDSFERGFWMISAAFAQDPNILTKKNPAPQGTAEERLKILQQPIIFALATAEKIKALKTSYSKKDDFKKTVGFLEELSTLLKNGETIYSYADLTTPVKISNLPFPRFSDEARAAGIYGKIALLVLFKPDGTLAMAPFKTLEGAVMNDAYSAARDIKFKPAIKDGKPVAVIGRVDYLFQ